MNNALFQSDIKSLKLLNLGEVRDVPIALYRETFKLMTENA